MLGFLCISTGAGTLLPFLCPCAHTLFFEPFYSNRKSYVMAEHKAGIAGGAVPPP
jgi:hypothetical protein